jgi:uncharacterized protein
MQDQIGYDIIIETAMRDVIFKVLKKIEKEGLKGEHHFVITFSTKHFGVILSDALKERFPSEMTIIVQHQFQSLVILENCFKISLSFSGVMEELTVPYKAINAFADPSVNFGLKFNNIEADENEFLKVLDEDDLESKAIDPTLEEEIVSGKVVSLAAFRKNRDKKS